MSYESYQMRGERYPYPDLPKSTRVPLEQFIDVVNQSRSTDDQIDKATELSALNEQHKIVREFARNEINDEAYTAAALGVIYDHAHAGDGGVTDRKVQHILSDYLRDNKFSSDPTTDRQKKVYIAGLLGDRTRISKLRETSLATLGLNLPNNQQGSIDTALWEEIAPMARAETLRTAVENINIESLLIAAAEALQRLNARPSNNLATLQDITFVEQILEPMSEMIGFDSLAMALSSRTKEIRLANMGHQDLVDSAEIMLHCVDQFDCTGSRRSSAKRLVRDSLDNIFGLPMAFNAESAVEVSGPSEAVFGTITTNDPNVDISDEDDGTVGRFRLKSRGSLAWKLYQEERKSSSSKDIQSSDDFAPDLKDKIEHDPMDIMGITLICKDEPEQRRVFTELVNGVYHSPATTPRIANSKISPVHIAGMPDYIDRVMADLSGSHSDLDKFSDGNLPFMIDAKPAKDEDGLTLAKITFTYGGVPTEVQVVTAEQRYQMRCGLKAHVIYKARGAGADESDIMELVKILPEIHARRRRISQPDLVGSKRLSNGQHQIGDSEHEAIMRLEAIEDPNKSLRNTLGAAAVNL